MTTLLRALTLALVLLGGIVLIFASAAPPKRAPSPTPPPTPADRLISAADRGDTELVRELLATGIDVNAPNTSGYRALCAAAMEGHATTVQALLDAGANINATDGPYGYSALHWLAAREGRSDRVLPVGELEMARFLIQRGASIDARDEIDETPLHIASQRGRLPMVKLLRKSGANVNAETAYSIRPLDFALLGEHHEVVSYLRSQNALVGSYRPFNTTNCPPSWAKTWRGMSVSEVKEVTGVSFPFELLLLCSKAADSTCKFNLPHGLVVDLAGRSRLKNVHCE